MPTRLTGIPSFAYVGVEAPQPPNIVQEKRAPTITDFLTFNTGDLWLNIAGLSLVPQVLPTAGDIWMLVSKQRNIGRWVNFGGGGGNVISLTGDAGGPVLPAAGNINVFGVHGINTLGNAAPNTLRVAIDNAITLGDLAVIAANNNALSATTGDINIAAGNLKLPNTNAALTEGVIAFGGNRFVHNFGGNNTFVGQGAGNGTLTVVAAVSNTAIGTAALDALTTGSGNCAFGVNTLTACTTSSNNLAIGTTALASLATGTGNNVAIGSLALSGITTGTDNTAIGQSSGGALTTNDSNNIMIGNTGTAADNNRIRIGTPVTHTRCFIAGIRGVTTDVNDAIAVLIDSAGQLGTVSSSLRYKDNIHDMGDESSVVMDLRPVVFNYKKHPEVPAWGLIAEEVSEIFPQLVVYDDEGLPETVKYHELSVLLLNELKKLSKRVEDLELYSSSRKK